MCEGEELDFAIREERLHGPALAPRVTFPPDPSSCLSIGSQAQEHSGSAGAFPDCFRGRGSMAANIQGLGLT